MGLQSALSTALTGLKAAETTIDVVGNNVANSQTVGFKSSEAVFATQFLQTQSLGSGPTTTRGGTNPRQIGLGTKVAEITPDFTQGTIEISANPLDLAIQGDGFLIVEGAQGGEQYTRNGQLKTNSNNELVTVTGQRLLGFGVDDQFVIQETGLVPLTIPLGGKQEAQATQNVFLEGILPPAELALVIPGIIQSAVLGNASFDIPSDLAVSDVNTLLPPSTAGSSGAASATGGAVGTGTYSYRITFVDGSGFESPGSVAIGPITVANPGEDTIDLSGLPPADGVTFVSRNVYRTDATGTGAFSLVANIPAAGTTYQDTTADGGLGAALNTTDLAVGNYGYYVTFFDSVSGVESRPTSLMGPLNIATAGQRIRLQNIPDPAAATNGDFDQVKIYRTLSSNPNVFHELTTRTAAQVAGGTSSFIDNIADSAISGNSQVNLNGPVVNSATNLVDLSRYDGTAYIDNLFEVGTLSFTGRKGGRLLGTQTLNITATTTVNDLATFMEDSLGIQSGGTISGTPGITVTGSQFVITSNNGTQSEVSLDLSTFTMTPTSTGIARSISLPFTTSQAADGESAVTDFVVYDSLGESLNVRLTVVLESIDNTNTTYRWFADSSDNSPITGTDIAVGTGTITFDGGGNFVSTTNANVSIERNRSPASSPLPFVLDFSQLSGLAADNASIAASRQDGSPPGTLSSFIITESGRIRGVFSNGVSRDLGQIRLARFANNAGLEQLGENLYAAGVNSGLAVLGNPGEQGIGTISAGAVELSNTDIGQNLIELILASTQYRGGTRVITAVQQLLDELLSLRR